MDVSIVVQTCDKYEKYWHGFFYYMDKFWDKNIDCPIYFCNESKTIKSSSFIHMPTGHGTFVENLRFILRNIKTKYVFYLLEDFWPMNNFSKNLFFSSFDYLDKNNLEVFQVSHYLPYYDLIPTNEKINNQKIFKFSEKSKWRFNFQSRFWKKDYFEKCLYEPQISEAEIKSAISVEIACDDMMDKKTDVYFYHYFWYPISGVSYRGNFTKLGEEMQNNMMVDLYGKNI